MDQHGKRSTRPDPNYPEKHMHVIMHHALHIFHNTHNVLYYRVRAGKTNKVVFGKERQNSEGIIFFREGLKFNPSLPDSPKSR